MNDNTWNNGTSNTYLHYQKIYQNVFLKGEKQERIGFQKEFFLTEMNDLPSEKSFNFKRINELRKNFIKQREELFKLPFFKLFPVVIIASGHYARDHEFDIEKIFDVQYVGSPVIVDTNWYNLHFSKDKKRMVLHTRQLSTSVGNQLIS